MWTRTNLWRRLWNSLLLLCVLLGGMSLNGCIFIRGGHHHHWHHDWD